MVKILSPRMVKRWLLLNRVLVEVGSVEVELNLVGYVYLTILSLALVALGCIRSFSKAACALWVSVLHDHLALTLSNLEERMYIKSWRILHHE